jgi:hypothetical protein
MAGEGAFDFSENNLKECEWFARTGRGRSGCDGGNYWRIVNLMTKMGTVMEACDPYEPYNSTCDSTCPYVKTVLDWRVITLAEIPSPELLKSYLVEYGPIYVTLDGGMGSAWRNELNNYDGSYTLYYPSPYTVSHAVLIVGWDDTLSHAGGQGAWIVKNSWGTDWGGTAGYGTERGYFTIAYGSANIGWYSSFLKEWKDYDPCDRLLSYDEAGYITHTGFGDSTAWAMCKFIADENMILDRVEFWTTDATTDVDIHVYGDFDGTSLSNLLASELNNSFTEMGYHSVQLTPPVPMSVNQDFYVAVKISNAAYVYPLALDVHAVGPRTPGRCYVSPTGATWSELIAGDLGVRARMSTRPDCIHLGMADSTMAHPCQDIQIPVTVSDVTGWDVMAFDMQICWCDVPQGLIQFLSCEAGPVMPPGWYIECNPCAPNCITVAAAGAIPLVGEGDLFYLNFHVSCNAKPCMCCDLTFEYVNLYDPENPLIVCWDDGSLCVEWCDIYGYVNYWKCCEDECGDPYFQYPLPFIRAHLSTDCVGPIATTYTADPDGYYEFTCLDPLTQGCSYCVELDECSAIQACINAYDASLVLQHIVCMDDLDDCQFISEGVTILPQREAADVSCNGTVTSYDASLILQWVADWHNYFPCLETWIWYALPAPCTEICSAQIDWIGVQKGDVDGCEPCPEPPAPSPLSTVVVRLGEAVDLGDRFEVAIEVEGAMGIYSGEYDLTFDISELYVMNVVPADLALGSMIAYHAEAGALRSAMAASQAYGGSGEVALITLGKMHTGAGISSLTLTDAFFNNGTPQADIGGGAGVIAESHSWQLGPVVPNPFRYGTSIGYSVPQASHVTIEIYNVNGQLVTTLIDSGVGAGRYSVMWSGEDAGGEAVARGVYFCRMQAGQFAATTKVVLLD